MNANAQTVAKKIERKAELSSNLKDVHPGPCELLGYKDKPATGVWNRIKLHDKQVLVISTGEMAARHNDKVDNIFTDETVEEGAVVTFRPDLLIGIQDGNVIFA